MPTAVVFDCDGVLFDSWRANVAYYDAIRAALGLAPMNAEWRERAHVLAASQLIDRMFADDPALLVSARAAARGIDYTPFYALMEPVPDLFDVLTTLRRTHRLGMASNRGTTIAGVMAHFGLGAWIDAAVGVLDVAQPKPAPDVIETCVARLGVAPADAVYVGDAESDLAAAQAAGVHFVAVGTAAWSPARVPALRDLPRYLAARANGR